jgi:hypothetical protein
MSDKKEDRIKKLREEPAFRDIVNRLRSIPEEKRQELLVELNDQAITEGTDHD